MTSTNAQIRAKARALLGGNIFANNWLLALVVGLIVTAIISTASSFTCGIGTVILYGPLYAGLAVVFLKLVRTGNKINIEDTFAGFKNFGDMLVLGLMQTIFIFLWSLLFVIPGIVKTYAYSMIYYIKADHPEYTWQQCMNESKAMTKGYKWKLFCLDFSFIGWILLSGGIGTLWVTPYMEASRAVFYNELKGEPAPEEEAPADDISAMAINAEEAAAKEAPANEENA